MRDADRIVVDGLNGFWERRTVQHALLFQYILNNGSRAVCIVILLFGLVVHFNMRICSEFNWQLFVRFGFLDNFERLIGIWVEAERSVGTLGLLWNGSARDDGLSLISILDRGRVRLERQSIDKVI